MATQSQDVGGHILIVDDYPANLKLLERNLQAAGYETLTAHDGEEALLRVESDRPDLILLDIMLPKIDGFEVCRRLRASEATAVIPVIMVTALKETEDRIRGLEAGADDFISKPFDRGELLARVKSLLQIKYYRSMLAEREKFHAVIQDLSHGIVITDGRWRVQTMSRRAAELLGHVGRDPTGRDLADVLAAFQVEPSLEALRQTVSRSVSIELMQETARPYCYLAGRYTRIEGPRGELINAAFVFRDITEQREKERLKREFLHLVGHKLKTPLSVVGMALWLIDGGHYGQVPPPMVGPIRKALARSQELADLIREVMAYAALTTRELERAGQVIPLEPLIRQIEAALRQRYPTRPIQWAVNLPPAPPRARAPEELLSLVLMSLADNAAKFNRKESPRVEINVHEIEDRRLHIAVRDDGPGIRPEDTDRIFTDFSQLEDTFSGNVSGMGLGLAMAKRLVESWGGQITVESRPGEGSTFAFTVPSEHTPAREVPERQGQAGAS